MSKIIYLAAYKAYHPNYDMVYQDINGLRDIDGDMMDVNLDSYDIIIATPPCNYWSRANNRRETSEYSQKTKHLLPEILKKLCNQEKPFIVENVINAALMNQNNLFNFPCFIYTHGRHTYWTNFPFNPSLINQNLRENIKFLSKKDRQGGENVHNVIEYWLELVNG